MTMHDLWNECVDKTSDIPSCLELYTGKIKKAISEKFIKEILDFLSNEDYEDSKIEMEVCGLDSYDGNLNNWDRWHLKRQRMKKKILELNKKQERN